MWGAEARLVPEVSIGELDGPEEYLFGRIGSLAVDDDRNVYVFDRQAHHVRVFDDAGVYVRTLGRRGEGPGDFGRAEAIAVLPDGRLLVRDPGNMRVQVFDPASGETDEWAYNSGNTYRSGAPLHTDVRGRTFLLTSDQSGDDIVIILGQDGTHLDTLPEPSGDHEPVMVRAEHTTAESSSRVSAPVPFTPRFFWAVHSTGHFLTGLSSGYRIDLVRDDGVLRIERDYEPVPVSDGERDYWRESTVQMIRFTVPDWTWDGPPDPRPQADLHRAAQRPGWTNLGDVVDCGAACRKRGLRPGESLFAARHLAGIDTLRCLRARRHLSGCRRTAGCVLRRARSCLRRRSCLGGDPGRTGGRAGRPLPDRGGWRVRWLSPGSAELGDPATTGLPTTTRRSRARSKGA